MALNSLSQDIAAHLNAEGLRPTSGWLTSFLQSIDPNRPVAALRSTARFRVLASDITESIQSSSSNSFPLDISNGNIKEQRLPGPLLVQILDIEDIGHSRWSQVEEIEATERGETTKGREVIRVIPSDDGGADTQTPAHVSSGPHKLVLQDAHGQQAYGIELSTVEGLNLNMNIGTKLLLKDVVVARGVLLLEPRNVQQLGGKIDRLHKSWREGRKERLKAAAGMVDREQ